MKKFNFPKYLKYVSSISEWSSSLYTFNKRNLFLINNNEKKTYVLFYHYLSSNVTFKKLTTNVRSFNIKLLYNNFFNKLNLSKLFFVKNILNFLYPDMNNSLFFFNNESINNNKGLIKKTLRLNRLLKYRLRRKSYLKFFKNRSVNKVYVSKPEIKYSIKDVIITVYVYNRERISILKKLATLNNFFFIRAEKSKFKHKNIYKKRLLQKSLKKWGKISFPFNFIKRGTIFKIINLTSFYNESYNNINKTIEPNNIYTLLKLNNNKYILNNIKKIFYMNLKKVFISKFYISVIYLINFKFNNNNLTELKNKLYKIYNRRVILNIVNLKYLYLENTIFLDALINKLNDRKKKALKVIRKGLSLGKVVKLHPLFYRDKEVVKSNLNEELNRVDDRLDNLVFKLKKNKYINIISRLKNKHVSGLRIEAKGRLTKRLTASRAIYKVSYKGSLKNIYSSYNKLSTIVLRGLSKSNNEYVNTNSKNRNGSYGIKYWISTY
jgi:hypothetical protein